MDHRIKILEDEVAALKRRVLQLEGGTSRRESIRQQAEQFGVCVNDENLNPREPKNIVLVKDNFYRVVRRQSADHTHLVMNGWKEQQGQ